MKGFPHLSTNHHFNLISIAFSLFGDLLVPPQFACSLGNWINLPGLSYLNPTQGKGSLQNDSLQGKDSLQDDSLQDKVQFVRW